jgi:polyisoprenoid-binding protein YceI
MTSFSAPTPALPLPPGRWNLDNTHSGVSFVVRHLGLSNVRGRFDEFYAVLDVGADLASTFITAFVDLSSVDTNNADRDAHLRSTDFFDTDRHPRMRFRSTAISGAGDRYELTGELTIVDATRPLTLDVEFNGTEMFPGDGHLHAGFTATGEIRRSEFGIDFGIVPGAERILLGDKVKLDIDVQFVAP